ncbi:MAG: RodZ domain-containing protein [Halopseudomonas aestusnigri]
MQKTQDNNSGGETPDIDQAKITVADILRTGREKRGQDLRAVANVLRIRYVFLEAIERGDFASLPGDTYAYGFVRTYAGYLNLDTDEIVRQFKREVESYGARKTLVFPTPVPESKTPGLAILLTSVLLLAIAYGGWTVVSRFDVEIPDWIPFMSHGETLDADGASVESSAVGQDESNAVVDVSSGEEAGIVNEQGESAEVVDILPPIEDSQEDVVVEAEEIAVVIPAIPESSNTPENTEPSSEISNDPAVVDSEPVSPTISVAAVDSSVSDSAISASEELGVGAEANEVGSSGGASEVTSAIITPPPPPEPEVFGDEGVASAISIFAEQDAWIHIVDVSGEAIFSRVLRAGSVYNVPKREGLLMTTGNAGGIILKVNGKDLPRIGPIGDVKRNIVLSEDGVLESIQAD